MITERTANFIHRAVWWGLLSFFAWVALSYLGSDVWLVLWLGVSFIVPIFFVIFILGSISNLCARLGARRDLQRTQRTSPFGSPIESYFYQDGQKFSQNNYTGEVWQVTEQNRRLWRVS